MTKQDNLQKAIEALGAVEVAPGRYAYQDHFGFWYAFPEAKAANLPGGYAQAMALKATLMPAWWSPDRRYAWRQLSYRDREPTGRIYTEEGATVTGYRYERITASLETGEEISA